MSSNDTIPEKMLACQVVEFNKPYKIHEIPTPSVADLQPHELLVKVAVASLCHTDFMVTEGIMGTKLPCTASHEGSGTVAAAGTSASKSFPVGTRVLCGLFRDQCGKCEDCKGPENYRQYCPNSQGAIGVNVDGNFAEYVVIDGRNAARLPDKVSFETAAPLACAGCTIWRGILQSKVEKGEWLALVGAGGGLGHLGLQFAQALGIKVIAIDARDESLELIKSTGAELVLDAREGDDAVVEKVHKATDGIGAKATVNVSDAKGAAATACKVTRMHGLMVQIAQPPSVDIPFAELVFRDIRVQGSLICSPEEGKSMLDIVAEHGISVTANSFNGLHEIPKLVELATSGKMKGKGVIVVDQKQVEDQKKGVKGDLA